MLMLLIQIFALALLRTVSDNYFYGANVENIIYPTTQCAEASAIGAMIAMVRER